MDIACHTATKLLKKLKQAQAELLALRALTELGLYRSLAHRWTHIPTRREQGLSFITIDLAPMYSSCALSVCSKRHMTKQNCQFPDAIRRRRQRVSPSNRMSECPSSLTREEDKCLLEYY